MLLYVRVVEIFEIQVKVKFMSNSFSFAQFTFNYNKPKLHVTNILEFLRITPITNSYKFTFSLENKINKKLIIETRVTYILSIYFYF